MPPKPKLSLLQPFDFSTDPAADSPSVPRSQAEWISFIHRVLKREVAVCPERTAGLCLDVCRRLLAEKPPASPSVTSAAAAPKRKRPSRSFSPAEGSSSRAEDELGSPASANSERVEASGSSSRIEDTVTTILVARAMCGLEMSSSTAEVETAQELSAEAYQLQPDGTSPLAAFAYVLTSYYVGLRCFDQGEREAQWSLTREVAMVALQKILPLPAATVSEHSVNIACRLAWVYAAAGGDTESLQPILTRLQALAPQHYLLLLLVGLLSTPSSSDDEASCLHGVLAELTEHYGNDVPVLLFLARVYRVESVGPTKDGRDVPATLITTAIARTEELTQRLVGTAVSASSPMLPPEQSTSSKRGGDPSGSPSLMEMALPDVVGEKVGGAIAGAEPGDAALSYHRVSMLWALIAHTASHTGCYSLAMIAVDRGFALLEVAPRFLAHVYADLLTTRVEVELCQWAEKHFAADLAGTATDPFSVLQAVLADPLRLSHPSTCTAAASCSAPPPAPFTHSDAPAATLASMSGRMEDVSALSHYLFKAIDSDPSNGAAYYWLGCIRALEAITYVTSLPHREMQLEEAIHYFHQAALLSAAYTAPASYLLGCVLAGRGDTEASLNFFSSALQASEHATLLPFERVMFLILQ